MVKAGMTWRFDKYSKDAAFQRAEQEAQRTRRGLWVEPSRQLGGGASRP